MVAPLLLVCLTVGLRLGWVALVPTVPRSDYEMYFAAAGHLARSGTLDPGLVTMPGWVAVLAGVLRLGGGLVTAKLVGVAFAAAGAAALYAVTAALAGRKTALVATGLFAVWPAGIALGSVLGTDMPFVALLLLALLPLVRAQKFPAVRALAAGVLLGLAAFVRAVALPLAAVIGLAWWLPRCRPMTAVARTGLMVGACLLTLLPWALRNRARQGEWSFTDYHGGATALLGSYPNTDGTYAPAALDLITHLTGSPFYTEPHAQHDRVGYQLARQLRTRHPLFAMAVLAGHAERLLSGDEGVLCWSATCPGVLPDRAAAGFEPYRGPLVALANTFYYFLAGGTLIGLLVALRERRTMAFLLGGPAIALAALYVLYFGTPRYHVTLEALAFPFAALAATRLPERDAAGRILRSAVAALMLVLLARMVMHAASVIRAQRRWGVLACHVDGVPRVCAFEPQSRASGPSPIVGGGGRVDVDGVAPLRLEVLGAWPDPGHYRLTLTIAGAPAPVVMTVIHAGGPFSHALAFPAPVSVTGVELERDQ